MSITTKRGDEGMTLLIGGKRVLKSDARVEAYGSVDELSAFIGVLHDTLDDESVKVFLMDVQKNLLTVEAVLACEDEGKVIRLDPSAVLSVTDKIGALERELPPFRSFILPGGNLVASYCHVCRTVCRRAERAAVRVGLKGLELQYLNRMSDYFFLLARKHSL